MSYREIVWGCIIAAVVVIFCYYGLFKNHNKQPANNSNDNKSNGVVKKRLTINHFEIFNTFVFLAAYTAAMYGLIFLSLTKIANDYPMLALDPAYKNERLPIIAVIIGVLVVYIKRAILSTDQPPSKKVRQKSATTSVPPMAVTNIKQSTKYKNLLWLAEVARSTFLSLLIVFGGSAAIVGCELFISTYVPSKAVQVIEGNKIKNAAIKTALDAVAAANSSTLGLITSLNGSSGLDINRILNTGTANLPDAEEPSPINTTCFTMGLKAKADRAAAITGIVNDFGKLIAIKPENLPRDIDALTKINVHDHKWIVTSGTMTQSPFLQRVSRAIDESTINTKNPAEICNFEEILRVFDVAIKAINTKAEAANELIEKLSDEIEKPAQPISMFKVYTSHFYEVLVFNFILFLFFSPRIEQLLNILKYKLAKKALAVILHVNTLLELTVTTTPDSYLIFAMSDFNIAKPFLTLIFEKSELTLVKNDQAITNLLNASPERFNNPVSNNDVIFVMTDEAMSHLTT